MSEVKCTSIIIIRAIKRDLCTHLWMILLGKSNRTNRTNRTNPINKNHKKDEKDIVFITTLYYVLTFVRLHVWYNFVFFIDNFLMNEHVCQCRQLTEKLKSQVFACL